MRIVFFGTPPFARTILEYLISQNVEVAAVVTRPDKKGGRSNQPLFSSIKNFAISQNLPLYQPQKASDPEFAEFLKGLNADFFIVAAYAEILKQNILDIPRLACLNVHGSILPKYRGAAPVQRSIMEGNTETGVTIMKMALEMDTGDIFAISKTEILPDMNAGELMNVLAELGKVALFEVMQALEKGTATREVQDPALATYAKKITPADAEVIWSNPAKSIHDQIRGVNPNPGAWVWNEIKKEKKRLLIKKAEPNLSLNGPPGQIISRNSKELLVACSEGSLSLLEVQLEGKKSLQIEDFLRGISLDKIKF